MSNVSLTALADKKTKLKDVIKILLSHLLLLCFNFVRKRPDVVTFHGSKLNLTLFT